MGNILVIDNDDRTYRRINSNLKMNDKTILVKSYDALLTYLLNNRTIDLVITEMHFNKERDYPLVNGYELIRKLSEKIEHCWKYQEKIVPIYIFSSNCPENLLDESNKKIILKFFKKDTNNHITYNHLCRAIRDFYNNSCENI